MISASIDLLVLGAGLAGLRAAWAAQEACPQCSVLVASRRPGPSGSSFANRNDALGVQVPLDDAEREAFKAEVLDLAGPGWVDPALVDILAEEGQARFRDMEALKLRFRGDASGMKRFPGCGSIRPGAYVFDGLRNTFARFEMKALELGVSFNSDITIMGLLSDGARCCGAWGFDGAGHRVLIKARSVIMALGGPAPLFRHRVCGPANDGTSWTLLHKAGCRLANTGYLQFLWYTRDKQYVCPSTLVGPEALILAENGESAAQFAPELLAERRTHCPAFVGRADSGIDAWLAERADEDGFVRVRTPGGVVEAAPMAHAGNGGAVVDEHGATDLPGLYAIGECATGMHGANRLGGAMVLATQVFGKRAGEAAARHALDAFEPQGSFDSIPQTPETESAQAVCEIREGMQRHAAPFARKGLDAFATRLGVLADMHGGCTRLMAESARIVADGYLTNVV